MTEIKEGEKYTYGKTGKQVTVIMVSDDYAMVEDEKGNTISTHIKNLWSKEDILIRES